MTLQHLQTNVLFVVRLADQVLLGAPACAPGGPDGLAVIRVVHITVIIGGFAWFCRLIVSGADAIGQVDRDGTVRIFLDVHDLFCVSGFGSHGDSLDKGFEAEGVAGHLADDLVIADDHE